MEEKYTSYERKQIAEAFKAAVSHLDDGTGQVGKCVFICLALERSGAPYWGRAVEVVGSRMGEWCSLRGWLRYSAGVPSEYLSYPRVQAHRHAWRQELIREFSQP